MTAIEFQAKVEDGSIAIPDEFRDKLAGIVRVIVLTEDRPANAEMIDRLLASPIKLGDFKPLTREEANR